MTYVSLFIVLVLLFQDHGMAYAIMSQYDRTFDPKMNVGR